MNGLVDNEVDFVQIAVEVTLEIRQFFKHGFVSFIIGVPKALVAIVIQRAIIAALLGLCMIIRNRLKCLSGSLKRIFLNKALTLKSNWNTILCSAQWCVDNQLKILMELSMYAVVKTGGKQYKVTVGEKLKVEQIPAELDSQIELNEVLMIADGESVKVGAPFIEGAKVTAKVVAHGRGEKIRIFKMRRRKHYQKRQGHRQNFTQIEIVAIA